MVKMITDNHPKHAFQSLFLAAVRDEASIDRRKHAFGNVFLTAM